MTMTADIPILCGLTISLAIKQDETAPTQTPPNPHPNPNPNPTPTCVDCHKKIVLYFQQSCLGAVVLFICPLQNFMEPIPNKMLG